MADKDGSGEVLDGVANATGNEVGTWEVGIVEKRRLGAKSASVNMLGLIGFTPECLNAFTITSSVNAFIRALAYIVMKSDFVIP